MGRNTFKEKQISGIQGSSGPLVVETEESPCSATSGTKAISHFSFTTCLLGFSSLSSLVQVAGACSVAVPGACSVKHSN